MPNTLPSTLSRFRRLTPFVSPFLPRLLSVFALSLFGTVLGLLSPLFTKILIDDVLLARNLRLLWILSGIMVLATVLGYVIGAVNRYYYTQVTARILFALRAHLFSHLQALSLRFDSEYEGLTFSLAWLYKYPWFLVDFPAVDGRPCKGRGCAALATANIRTTERIHIIGGAFDYQFNNFLGIENVVLRNETALYLDDLFYLPTTEVVQKHHFQTMWGIDKFAVDPQWLQTPALARLGFGAAPWFISFQVWQDWIINPNRWNNAYIDGGSNNFSFDTLRVTNGLRNGLKMYVTSYISKDLLADQTLHFENFLLGQTHFEDFWEHVQLKYDWNEFTNIILGYNAFFGRPDGPLGSNKNLNYVYFSIKVGI